MANPTQSDSSSAQVLLQIANNGSMINQNLSQLIQAINALRAAIGG